MTKFKTKQQLKDAEARAEIALHQSRTRYLQSLEVKAQQVSPVGKIGYVEQLGGSYLKQSERHLPTENDSIFPETREAYNKVIDEINHNIVMGLGAEDLRGYERRET